MNQWRFRLGLVTTAAWLLLVGAGLYFQRSVLSSMPPNAWGDFFAGVFSPLAFLWLILGYLQQGEELRLSTEALRLQAAELQNSVEQQRALVEVTRLQLEGERESRLQERSAREEAAKPVFTLASSGVTLLGDGRSTYNIALANVGNVALGLTVDVQHHDGRVQRLHSANFFDRGQHHTVQVEFRSPDHVYESTLVLAYRDSLSRTSRLKYCLAREGTTPQSGLILQRAEA